MDLTPSERAVLGQIRVLYENAPRRDHPLKALTMQWPPLHYDAYKSGYAGLLAKRLIKDGDAHSFKITDAGLKFMGVAASAPSPRVDRTRRTAEDVKRAASSQGVGSQVVAAKEPVKTRLVILAVSALALLALGILAGLGILVDWPYATQMHHYLSHFARQLGF